MTGDTSKGGIERKGGALICEFVFGDDWKKCVSPHGRKRLKELIESGELRIERPERQLEPETANDGGGE